jgi:peptidoglycan hydrolase-like protein with peptidoglycan-binding domain
MDVMMVTRILLRLMANRNQFGGLLENIRGELPKPAEPTPAPSGYSVEWLQESLNEVNDAGLEVDGDYGPATKAAVMEFQETRGLKVDGWAGIQTCAQIQQELEVLEQKV